MLLEECSRISDPVSLCVGPGPIFHARFLCRIFAHFVRSSVSSVGLILSPCAPAAGFDSHSCEHATPALPLFD
jgi:hypothetical protein